MYVLTAFNLAVNDITIFKTFIYRTHCLIIYNYRFIKEGPSIIRTLDYTTYIIIN